MVSDETIQQAAKVIAGKTTELGSSTMRGLDRAILAARALDEAGLLAPSPLTEEWLARYANGGGAVCRTRDEAEAELDRMIRDSHRPKIEEPPTPEIAGIYTRYVSDWEQVEP